MLGIDPQRQKWQIAEEEDEADDENGEHQAGRLFLEGQARHIDVSLQTKAKYGPPGGLRATRWRQHDHLSCGLGIRVKMFRGLEFRVYQLGF